MTRLLPASGEVEVESRLHYILYIVNVTGIGVVRSPARFRSRPFGRWNRSQKFLLLTPGRSVLKDFEACGQPSGCSGAIFPLKKVTNYLGRPFQEGPLREPIPQAWNRRGADSTGLDSRPLPGRSGFRSKKYSEFGGSVDLAEHILLIRGQRNKS